MKLGTGIACGVLGVLLFLGVLILGVVINTLVVAFIFWLVSLIVPSIEFSWTFCIIIGAIISAFNLLVKKSSN